MAVLNGVPGRPGHGNDSFTATDIEGRERSLAEFDGKVLHVVNVASKCGFTPRYAGLHQLSTRFKDRGFEVLGFPADSFLRQEPGTNEETRNFCSVKYNVTFPMFGKVSVAGRDIHPLYAGMTSTERNPELGGRIAWNFTKFLADRNGVVIGRFTPADDPPGEKVAQEVEAALGAEVHGSPALANLRDFRSTHRAR